MITGDQLARGGISAVFPACESGVSEDKWKAAFEHYDGAAFLANQEAEAQAVQERKALRLLQQEKELEERDRERQSRQTEAATEASSDEQLEMRFGDRFAHVAPAGVSSLGVGESK
jgi:hypothetical protein